MRLGMLLRSRWHKMPQNSPYTLEICVESPAAIAASAAVADRIELCSALDLGGLTPDFGMRELAAEVGVQTHVLIRPRSGDFSMSAHDLTAAVSSIRAAKQLGLKGVVIGAEKHGKLDRKALEAMVRAADGLDVTLHRVVDVVSCPEDALAIAVDLGVIRILTSGGAKSALEGIAGLNRLHVAAAGRIEIMAGSGIKSTTLPDIIANTPVTSFHASCSNNIPVDGRYSGFGFGQTQRAFDLTEATKIATLLKRPKISNVAP